MNCKQAGRVVSRDYRWILSLFATVGLYLLALTPSVWAAKPVPKPAPTCSGSLGQPALAFPWDYQIYVGNAAGTCALALAPMAQNNPPGFATNGSRYRIVWSADTRDEAKRIAQFRYTVKMVEFTLSNGSIVEPRPLAVKELWRDSVTTSQSSVGAVAINTAGDQVIFTRTYGGVVELKSIDLTSCTPACAAATTIWIPEAGTTAFGADFGRAGDARIYASQTFASGLSRMVFIEKDGATWQGPREIARNDSGHYMGVYRFGPPSLTLRDWDGDGNSDDLIALVRGYSNDPSDGAFDVLRLEPSCTLTGSGACVDTGDATVEASDIWAGWLPYSAEWTPAGNLLRTIDPVDSSYGNNHIETVDPKTQEVLVDHGYGQSPAGLEQ